MLIKKLMDHHSGEGAYRARLADGADRSEADILPGRSEGESCIAPQAAVDPKVVCADIPPPFPIFGPL